MGQVKDGEQKEHRHRLLVVDDKPDIHRHVRSILWTRPAKGAPVAADSQSMESTGAFFFSRGMKIDGARQGHEGIIQVRRALEAGEPYSLALVDMMMPPGLDGVETVERMWDIDPALQIVLYGRHFHQSWSEIANRLERADQYLILKKPFEKLELVQAVHALTEKWWLKKTVERANERRYRALYHATPAMFFTLAADGKVLSANKFGAEQLGYSIKELIGKPSAALHRERDQTSYAAHVAACIGAPDGVTRWQGCKVRKDGTIVWVRETTRMVPDRSGKPTLLSVCEDLTHTRRLSQLLSHQASHDSLTGLTNRREFEQRLAALANEGGSTTREHALCYVDLDQFKVVNDTCGHVAGDELLRQLTQLLVQRTRKTDTLARVGGDEFALLLADCALEDAERAAESVRSAVNDFRFARDGRTFPMSASIGVVPFTNDSGDIAEILKAADAARYAAKDAGRNRVRVYRADSEDLARRQGEMQWVSRIQAALESDAFCLFFQPIAPVDDPGQTTTHYEILVRLRDAEGNIIPPGAFMPAAERYHLATRIDRWVVRATLNWLRGHPRHLRSLDVCSINLSGQSFADDDFVEFLIGTLDGVPAEKLCFEVTETAAIANLSQAVHFMEELKRLGCRFSLDDFGSGLSSFAYLKNLPIDYLKIDGNFIRNIANDPIDLAMVTAIDQVGKVMGKRTVAEFVEDEATLECLRQVGVDYAQGYHLAKPRPIGALVEEPTSSSNAAA